MDRPRYICKSTMVCSTFAPGTMPFSYTTTDAAHILPILFSFTTPAKYCFRAIAAFIRQVTGMLPPSASESIGNIPVTLSPPATPGAQTPAEYLPVPDDVRLSRPPSNLAVRSTPPSREPSPRSRGGSLFSPSKRLADDSAVTPPKMSLRRAFSTQMSRAGVLFKSNTTQPTLPTSAPESSFSSPPRSRQSTSPAPANRGESGDVGGPRFYGSGMKESNDNERRAGETSVYHDGLVSIRVMFIPSDVKLNPIPPEYDDTRTSLDARNNPPT